MTIWWITCPRFSLFLRLKYRCSFVLVWSTFPCFSWFRSFSLALFPHSKLTIWHVELKARHKIPFSRIQWKSSYIRRMTLKVHAHAKKDAKSLNYLIKKFISSILIYLVVANIKNIVTYALFTALTITKSSLLFQLLDSTFSSCLDDCGSVSWSSFASDDSFHSESTRFDHIQIGWIARSQKTKHFGIHKHEILMLESMTECFVFLYDGVETILHAFFDEWKQFG